jgi:hypothetical protein
MKIGLTGPRQSQLDRIAAYLTILNDPLALIAGFSLDLVDFATPRAGKFQRIGQQRV